ncbi:MAG: type II toxin-antitoxin system VapC family toxin [Marmoricola sp.]
MGVSYLLDTHVLLWALSRPERLPEPLRVQLVDPANRLIVSSISAFEIATKNRLGNLPGVGPLLSAWPERISDLGAEELDVRGSHAVLAGSMGWAHRDPFDRMLVAQSIIEDLVLVTSDSAIQMGPTARVLGF